MVWTRVREWRKDSKRVIATTTIERVEVMAAIRSLLGDLVEDVIDGAMGSVLVGLAIIGVGSLLGWSKTFSIVFGLVPMVVLVSYYVIDELHGFFRYRRWEVSWTHYSYPDS